MHHIIYCLKNSAVTAVIAHTIFISDFAKRKISLIFNSQPTDENLHLLNCFDFPFVLSNLPTKFNTDINFGYDFFKSIADRCQKRTERRVDRKYSRRRKIRNSPQHMFASIVAIALYGELFLRCVHIEVE
jgi:hypothetical protein